MKPSIHKRLKERLHALKNKTEPLEETILSLKRAGILNEKGEVVNFMTKEDITPFEAAGYTKDTKFIVTVDKDYTRFNKGDIITLHKDDGSIWPDFINQDGIITCEYLPNHPSSLIQVYEEESPNQLTEEERVLLKEGHNRVKEYEERLEQKALSVSATLLTKIIVRQEDNHFGHSDLEIKEVTLDEVKELLALLEYHYNYVEKNIDTNPIARFHSDGSGSIYLENFWSEGNPLNKEQKDKSVFSWDNLV